MPVIEIKDIEAKTLFPGFEGQFVHSEKLTIAHFTIKSGSILPEHAHLHEQVTQVISGKLEITIEGHKQVLEAGLVAVIPSNAKHSGKAITDCYVIDVFTPVREDYRALQSSI